MKIKKFPLGDFGANCYILIDDCKDCVVIDPADADFVLYYLEKNDLHLEAILLTHGHFDHIWGVKKLKQFTGATVVCHKEDVELLHHPDFAMGFFGDFGCPPCEADKTVEDGDIFEFGEMEFTFLHTPGHSKGSMLIRCEDALFTGDTVFAGNVGRTDLYGGDMKTLLQSVQKIAEMDFNGIIFPGHGEVTTMEDERKTNYYFRLAMEKRTNYDDLL